MLGPRFECYCLYNQLQWLQCSLPGLDGVYIHGKLTSSQTRNEVVAMLTYAMLLQILIEAEARMGNAALPQDVRDRSSATASLCKQRMEQEGLSRTQLEEFARADARGTA